MGSLLLGLISVVLFCFCAHYFTRAIVVPLPALNQTQFSKQALRIKRGYKIFALGVMTFAFMIGLVISFYQVFIEL
jgi:hypothetical protein